MTAELLDLPLTRALFSRAIEIASEPRASTSAEVMARVGGERVYDLLVCDLKAWRPDAPVSVVVLVELGSLVELPLRFEFDEVLGSFADSTRALVDGRFLTARVIDKLDGSEVGELTIDLVVGAALSLRTREGAIVGRSAVAARFTELEAR